jgi:hypothetical protein
MADSAIEIRRLLTSDESEPTPCLRQGEFAPIIEIGEPSEHGSHEFALFLARLKIRKTLYHRDSATATGQKNRTTGFVGLPDDLAGVHLKITERDDIFREPDLATHWTSIGCLVQVLIIAPV